MCDRQFYTIFISTILLVSGCSGPTTQQTKPGHRGTQAPVFVPKGASQTAILTDARALASSALIYYKKAQYEAAEKEYHKAIDKLVLIDNHIEIGKVKNNLTLIYIKLKQWKKADLSSREAIAVFKGRKLYPDLARSLATRGRIFEGRRKYRKALELYSRALDILSKHRGRAAFVAEQLSNIGYAHFKLKQHKRALCYFVQSATIHNRNRNYSALAQDYTYLGKSSLALKRTNDAMRYFQNALIADKVTENPFGIALSLRHISDCYFLTGRNREAAEHLSRSIRINTVLKRTRKIVTDLKQLIRIYKKMDDMKKVRQLSAFYNKLRKKIN